MKLLAIIGSHRVDGNSYLLAKEVLESLEKESDYQIVQLAEKKIVFCDFCRKCETEDCILDDDFDQILDRIEEASGVIFSFPKYFSLPSKFLCFLERLSTTHYFKRYHGLKKTGTKPDPNFTPRFEGKPFVLFLVSSTGKGGEEALRIAAYELGWIGMKLIGHDSWPFLGVAVKGENRGDVLEDKKGTEDCRRIVRKLMESPYFLDCPSGS